MPPRIELVARGEPDLQSGHPDYSICAGEQRVGRIYQQRSLGREQRFWGLNTVTLDLTVGVPTHGNADSFDDALRSGSDSRLITGLNGRWRCHVAI